MDNIQEFDNQKTNINLTNTTINGIEKLKIHSLRDIEQQTHIDLQTIEYIINFDFEKLRNLKAKAMIKILEREYNIDLSDWVRKFDEYCKVLPVQEEKHMQIKPTLKKYDHDAIGGGGFKWSFLVIFIVILFVAGVAVKFPSIFSDFLNYENTKNQTASNITIQEENTKKPSASIVENDTPQVLAQDSISVDIAADDTTQTQAVIAEEAKTTTQEKSTEYIADVVDTQEETKQDLGYEYISHYATKEVKVKPIKLVWFELYDIKSKKIRTLTTKNPFTITNPTLVLTGNSLFYLEAAGQQIDFEDKSIRRRFYFDGDGVSIVDEQNYNKIKNLNK